MHGRYPAGEVPCNTDWCGALAVVGKVSRNTHEADFRRLFSEQGTGMSCLRVTQWHLIGNGPIASDVELNCTLGVQSLET